MSLILYYIILILVLLFCAYVVRSVYLGIQEQQKQFRIHMETLSEGKEELPAAEFMETVGMRGNRDFTGCYILHNLTKGMFYVGQSKSVLQRVTQHLTGNGNGYVYADYEYGDEFTIKTITLAQSGYDSLNALERDLIAYYKAYPNGYNRTRGNRD